MRLSNRIAEAFCRWRVKANTCKAERASDRAVTWRERQLHYAVADLLTGKPNTVDVSDPPFLPPLDQRAREAGA